MAHTDGPRVGWIEPPPPHEYILIGLYSFQDWSVLGEEGELSWMGSIVKQAWQVSDGMA